MMRIIKYVAPVAALAFTHLAFGQTAFVCGSTTCSAFGNKVITGIDNLVVDGSTYDVSFTSTRYSSPFAFSYNTAASGAAATGVDAANALDAFYETQEGPAPQDDGPGIYAKVAGISSPVWVTDLVTAYSGPAKNGLVSVDLIQPWLGNDPNEGPVSTATDVGDGLPSAGAGPAVSHDGLSFVCSAAAVCTVWTKVASDPPNAAPEIDPASLGSAVTLLIGGLIVLRGRRQAQPVRAKSA